MKALGHKVSVVVPNGYAEFLHWLPFNDDVVEFEGNEELAEQLINEAELIFCLDFNDLQRTDMMFKALEQSSGKFVMIDHTKINDFAEIVFSEPNICSGSSSLIS